MTGTPMIATSTAARRYPWEQWPHRVAALVATGICVQAWLGHRLGAPLPALLLNLLPYTVLEAAGRLPETPLARGLFLSGSLCISAGLVLHAHWFARASEEWARLEFLLIPVLQLAGVIMLVAVLTVFRLLKW